MSYTIFDEKKRETFLEYRRQGFTVKKICKSIGISESSADAWVVRGKKDLKQNKITDRAKFFVEYQKASEHEETFLVNKMYEIIDKAIEKGDLKTAFAAVAWMLERKYPETYSKQIKVQNAEDAVLQTLQQTGTQIRSAVIDYAGEKKRVSKMKMDIKQEKKRLKKPKEQEQNANE